MFFVVFETILSSSEILFSILQKSSLDISRYIHEIENFRKQLVDIIMFRGKHSSHWLHLEANILITLA
ncbi:Hypothetical predicted protein [Octopus vulgaris]|uniref:Uncharacterized protein n=1 Tax=Octopus vulgaris TaxID=6645 RepID=A0AA36BT99_OCTVU|nr:Hypothetical predicted protein [Octopus vulgaris]